MRLSKTQARILDTLQTPMSRHDLAAAIGAHPTYCAKALKQLIDAGLIEMLRPNKAFTYRATARLALVPIDTAPATPVGVQGVD
jgi:hypothetical protein